MARSDLGHVAHFAGSSLNSAVKGTPIGSEVFGDAIAESVSLSDGVMADEPAVGPGAPDRPVRAFDIVVAWLGLVLVSL